MEKFCGVLFGSLVVTVALVMGGISGWYAMGYLISLGAALYAAGYGLHMLGVLLLFSTIFVLAWKFSPE